MWKNFIYNECKFSEWVVIINNRVVEKAKTRQRIIDATEYLIRKRGFVKISSKEISKECGVSQGSIFLHFKTKDGLLTTILDSNIELMEKTIKESCVPSDDQDLFLKKLLDSISIYEDILSRIYRDYSYLDSELQKKVDNLEMIIKNLVYENVKLSSSKNLSIVDSFIAIDAFLSQVKDYLSSKDTFTTSNSVLRQKRGRISKLYKMLFN